MRHTRTVAAMILGSLLVITGILNPAFGLEPYPVQPACAQCNATPACQCGNCNGGIGAAGDGLGNDGTGCTPLLETTPGWNLYWDSCLTHWPNCSYIDPYAMSNVPTWYVGAEFVPLYRDANFSRNLAFGTPITPAPVLVAAPNPNDPPVLFQPPDIPNPLLSTSSFDNDFNSGVKLTLGRQFGDWYRLEGSYLGSYAWVDQAFVLNPVDPAVASLDIAYTSRMHTAELNLRRKIALPSTAFGANFLIGGRYTRIQETFDYVTTGPATNVAVATDNQLLGLQLGLQSQFLERNRMWVDFDIKGSINRNLASQNTLFNNAPTADQEEATTFIGDILLAYNYQFSPSFTLRLGYQATWITGVALAEQNLPGDLMMAPVRPAEVNHGGDIVYHGPVLGLTWVR